MKTILIIPTKNVYFNILKDISYALTRLFQCKTEINKQINIPEGFFNVNRKQYHSTMIINNLKKQRTRGFDYVLCVTDVDLYVNGLNFVFGEADISSKIAIISLARLRQEFYGLKPDDKLFKTRSIKEAIHEIGHLYGLNHCNNRKCIMFFSNSIKDTDLKEPRFCSKCIKKLIN